MKKLIIMAFATIATLSVNAQSNSCQEPGTFSVLPKVGVAVTNCSKFDNSNNTDYKAGLTAGVEGQYMFNDWFALAAGANYTQEGFKKSGVTCKLDYVTVPVTANFYVCKGLALKTGVEVDFKVKDTVSGFGWSGSSKDVADQSKFKDFKANNVVVSIPVGLSYEFKNIVLDARYTYGLTNAMGNANYDCKSNAFTFTVGYRF